MRPLEKAPNWNQSQYLDEVIKLLHDKGSQLLIAEINEKYLYWDKVKYQKTSDPVALWAGIKFSRAAQARQIHFGKHSFKYSLTDSIQRGLHEFDLYIGGHLGIHNIIPEDDKQRYLISSLMEEAIASGQIEGAVTTRKKAKEMLRKNLTPRNVSERMIRNNYQTIKHILNIKNEPITSERLFEIHKLITERTLEDNYEDGKYREGNEVNVVDATDGEVVYIPPDFKEIPQLMDDLFKFFNHNDEKLFIHPIIKGCIIHFMIGYIHPFVDGNGRTARALFYWYLLKNGYWLTEYLSISRLIVRSKAQYAKAFLYSEIDENDLTYFINYKIKAMQLAYDSLKEYIQRKISEKRRLVNFQRIKGINERQAIIIKWLHEEPDLIFSVKEIETRFNVANQTARTDLTGLEARGYLEGINLNKKTKAFCRSSDFTEILEKEMLIKK